MTGLSVPPDCLDVHGRQGDPSSLEICWGQHVGANASALGLCTELAAVRGRKQHTLFPASVLTFQTQAQGDGHFWHSVLAVCTEPRHKITAEEGLANVSPSSPPFYGSCLVPRLTATIRCVLLPLPFTSVFKSLPVETGLAHTQVGLSSAARKACFLTGSLTVPTQAPFIRINVPTLLGPQFIL